MGKVELTILVVCSVLLLDGMISIDERIGECQSSEVVLSQSKKMTEKFGEFEYFVETVAAMRGKDFARLARMRKLWDNPLYKWCFAFCGADFFLIHVYKKCEDGRYCLVGKSLFKQTYEAGERITGAYYVDSLHVVKQERGQCLGTMLFFYTGHVAWQFAYGASACTLGWRADPFEAYDVDDEGRRAAQERLNRFYTRLGGVLIGKLNDFLWRGPALAPFELLEATS
jgi:hypothetical protein